MSTPFSTQCPYCNKLSDFKSSTSNGFYSYTCPSCHKVFYVQFKDGKPVLTRK